MTPALGPMTFSLSRPTYVRRLTAGAHLLAASLVSTACGGGDAMSPTSDLIAARNMQAARILANTDAGWTTIARRE